MIRAEDLKHMAPRFTAAGLAARLVEPADPDVEDAQIKIFRGDVDTRVYIQVSLVGGGLYVNEHRDQDDRSVILSRGRCYSLREASNLAIQVIEAKTQVTVESRVQAITAPFSQPWRWFRDGDWIVLEPPHGLITAETMSHVQQHDDTHTVEAVFRATPNPGVYLRFRLRGAQEGS